MQTIRFLKSGTVKRGIVALAVFAAAVLAVGVQVERADAQAPIVSAGGPYAAIADQPVQLNGVLYLGTAIAAGWTFGDGASIDGLSVVRTFATPGTYTATLTVTDASGYVFSDTTLVTVSAWATGVLNGHVLINGTLVPVQTHGSLNGVNPDAVSTSAPLLTPATGLSCNDSIASPSLLRCPRQ